MNTNSIIGLSIAIAALVALIAALSSMYPEMRRYLNMRNM